MFYKKRYLSFLEGLEMTDPKEVLKLSPMKSFSLGASFASKVKELAAFYSDRGVSNVRSDSFRHEEF